MSVPSGTPFHVSVNFKMVSAIFFLSKNFDTGLTIQKFKWILKCYLKSVITLQICTVTLIFQMRKLSIIMIMISVSGAVGLAYLQVLCPSLVKPQACIIILHYHHVYVH